jgi:glycosyltransferase involved in cell wall biosynthesis
MAGLGHEVHVIVADVDDPEAFYGLGHQPVGVAEQRIGGVEVHRLPYVDFTYRWMGRLVGQEQAIRSTTRRFGRLLGDRVQQLAPDVVVTLPHLFPNVEVIAQLRASNRWKLVYAPMLHEDDPYWSIERVSAVVRQADGVIALTDHERGRLLAAYGADAETTSVIPPGVALGQGTAYADRDPAVLFVGRRTASKRLDVLYEAMKIVWEQYPEVTLQLVGLPPGMGPDPAIWMAADPRVKIINGPIEREKERLLGMARVVISPSLTESFGITTLEAWAQATPVIVTDSAVNRSVVRDREDGLVATGSTALDLAKALARLLDDPGTASSMGEAGRRRVQESFTWVGSAASLDALLQRL